MPLEPLTIHLRHDQIVCACYEWAAARGFCPEGPKSMEIVPANDLVSLDTGDRKSRVALVFICDEPTGKKSWNMQGECNPYITRRDLPWLSAEEREAVA